MPHGEHPRGAAAFRDMPGRLPSHAAARAWRRGVKARVAERREAGERPGEAGPASPSMVALAELIARDGVVRMYLERMIREVPPEHREVECVAELLAHLDHILETAPEWQADPDKRVFFPFSALFSDMMMTEAGEAIFRNAAFNDALRAILREWCQFLDSADSRYVLNEGAHGWLCPEAAAYNELDDFVIPDRQDPHWGFRSYNDFFHRRIKPERRPVAAPDDAGVIVSANDGAVYRIARGVRELDSFWIKGEPYSLRNMLGGSDHLDRFVGGDVIQSYLSGADYHRWHAPVDGIVRRAALVEGLMFSNLEWAGNDIKGVKSQGYYTAVNTRGLTFIEADDPTIGMVCCMPVGITEVSSITHTRRRGERVRKGDELGYFSYGGSSVALIFQPGAIAHFTVEAPADPEKTTVPIKVNAQIATANRAG